MTKQPHLRILVIDDSAYNRRAISEIISEIPEVAIIDKASDGQEGLQLALIEKPDVITLDLEMPRLDGFTFLRLIMSARPTPVIVISSHANQENVFRALELGALDFVAKPSHRISKEILEIRDDVIRKVKIASNLTPSSLHRLPSYAPRDLSASGGFPAVRLDKMEMIPAVDQDAKRIIVMAASTGGPATLTRILNELPADLSASIVLVQHMPPKFTSTFASRLDRQCALKIVEASEVQTLKNGTVYIAPGDKSLEITLGSKSYVLHAMEPSAEDRYTPSANRLFSSAARTVKHNALGVVLTGMGDDGAQGASDLVQAGGQVVVESQKTAVVDGMPQSVLRLGVPATEEILNRIPIHIMRFADKE